MYRNLHYRLLNLWPLGLWIAAVVVAISLSGARSWRSEFVGVYDCDRSMVASVERGRIERIDVSVGDQVEAGQRIAQLETALVVAEMKDWEFERSERLSERGFERSLRLQDMARELRRARLELSSDQAELKVLRAELSRIEGLVERNLVDRDRYAELDARVQRLAASVRGGVEIVNTLESELEGTASAGNIGRDSEQTLSLEVLKTALSLRVHDAGIVAYVAKRAGDVALPGETVVEVLHPESAKIVGFLPIESAGRIQIGQEVEVFASRLEKERTRGLVKELSPSSGVSLESGQSQLGAGRSGLRFTVELDSHEGFIIGEPVTIKVLNETWLQSFASIAKRWGAGK